jgi:hypothetical protein
LRHKLPVNAGHQISMTKAVREALLAQYTEHKSWSIALHRDNLLALAETQRELQPVPSYSTVRRFFKTNGLERQRRLTSRQTEGALRAQARLLEREVRSYEAEYVGRQAPSAHSDVLRSRGLDRALCSARSRRPACHHRRLPPPLHRADPSRGSTASHLRARWRRSQQPSDGSFHMS